MLYPDATPIARMTEPQRAWFYAEYDRARRDETAGVLLAIFLGGLGIHHFYLGRTLPGVLYLVFSWTGIPTLLGWIECFLMSSRVREYNAIQASVIASQILSQPSPNPPYGTNIPPA